MLKNILNILILFSLVSCSSGMKVSSKEIQPIDNSFKGKFINLPYTTSKENSQKINLSNLFLINSTDNDTIKIAFDSKNRIKLTYNNVLGSTSEWFDGEFKRKGYYEFYFRKKRIEIPPLLPILFNKTDIYRLRLSLTLKGDLIVDSKFVRTGGVIGFAAGASSRKQYYYRLVD